jgi:hypothetical protein
MLDAQRVVSAVRAQIQDFATRIYHERLFSHEAETIFQTYQAQVDSLLAGTASRAFERLPQAFQRLSSQDPESISHALTTCRRVIDSFADAVFPPRPSQCSSGAHLLRLVKGMCAIGSAHSSTHELGSARDYERLNKTLGSLHDRLSAGVHDDVDAGEARALILQTYLFLGELLSLPKSAGGQA